MFRFRVKLVLGQWSLWIEGPLDRLLWTREHVDWNTVGHCQGQVQAPNLKMALVRLQHLIPELQED